MTARTLHRSRSAHAGQGSPERTFAAAVELYLLVKGEGKSRLFFAAAQRACDYLTELIGSKPLDAYTRADATAFRDRLFARGMAASSVTRTFTTVKAVYNFACAKWGFELRNPFANVYFDRTKGVKKRGPLSTEHIRIVQSECRRMDDDLRWIVALVSDTGARLAEIVGLAKNDIDLDHPDGPVLHIRAHPWRSLKTRGTATEKLFQMFSDVEPDVLPVGSPGSYEIPIACPTS